MKRARSNDAPSKRRVKYNELSTTIMNLGIMCLDDDEGVLVDENVGIMVRFGATIDTTVGEGDASGPPASQKLRIADQQLHLRIVETELGDTVMVRMRGKTAECDVIKFEMKFEDASLTEMLSWSYHIEHDKYCIHAECGLDPEIHAINADVFTARPCGDVAYVVLRLRILEEDEVE